MKSQKGKPTVYTEEKRQALCYNAIHDLSVKTATEAVCQKAEGYLEKLDTLYDMIVSEGLFRYYMVGYTQDPKRTCCRSCGEDIAKVGGIYSWVIDPLADPWKVKCPICGQRFPTNDFESYYKLGLDQKGGFSRERAQQRHMEKFGGLEGVGYLKNELYPEKGPAWGIDDGFGCNLDGKMSFEAGHGYYIAMYLHTVMYGNGSSLSGPVPNALKTFRDAYLYTGDTRYSRAGAILLDRIADFYPDYDWYQWHGLRGEEYRGNIVDPIWSNFLAVLFSQCYDAFYPAYEDPALIGYLSAKAASQGLSNPKKTADDLRANVEDGILRTIFRDAVRSKLSGNFGMTQSAVATAAVALNTLPETGQWLDWVMAASEPVPNTGVNPPDRTGGNLLAQLVDVVDHDGTGNESAPGYNRLWLRELLQVASVLQGYELYPGVDLYKNPKFLKMLYCTVQTVMGGYYTAQIGDSGSCGNTHLAAETELTLPAFMATGDPVFAQMLYLFNGRSAKGLRYPDTCKNPSRLEKDVEAVIQAYGELNLESGLYSGYGLMALRKNNRDFWVYTGSTAGHGHNDGLNLGLTAYGLNMMPELGYPKHTGPEHNRIQWVSATLSHNTVIVDEKTQKNLQDRGMPLHFDDTGFVRIMDADKHKVYPQTDIYRRTVVMVDVDDTVSYGVDFFRVRGGKEHLYSFHGASWEVAETEGLQLVKQEGGTYAGPDVPWGPDPSPLSGVAWDHNVFTYPDGYTWLDNVEKDLSPDSRFSVDLAVTDFNGVLEDSEGLHLRLTMVTDSPLDEVSIVNGYPPAKAGNPKYLKYVLARSKAQDTLFTAVIEPYKGSRYIRSIVPAEVVPADPQVRAAKITLENGRTDYVVYAADNTKEYTVDGCFRFRGFVGVTSFRGGKLLRAYLNDGDVLTDAISDVLPACTGTVADFTREMSTENSIRITPEQKNADAASMVGRYIHIENDGERSAVYRICGVQRQENGDLLLDIGDISPIRCYKDKFAPEKGYVYDMTPGAQFRIPLSYTL